MAKISILGAGSFGTALAVLFHRYGHQVALWGRSPEKIGEIRRHGENKRLLPGVPVDAAILLTSDIEDMKEADCAIIAVPSYAVRETAQRLRPILPPGIPVVNVSKGLEKGSKKRLTQVIAEELPCWDVVALSGPCHAEEAARGVPTTVVAACLNGKSAETVQQLLSNSTLRVYVSGDVIGVELSGALKNIIAVCAGICDGIDLGDNAKAALITRGLAEITRLGTVMGANPETFAGLAGIGDLVVTCTSMHSRNHRAGILIGQGVPPNEAIARIGMTVEGCIAAATAWELASEHQVSMPIVEQLMLVLTQGKDPRQAVTDLMDRPTRREGAASNG